MSKGMWCYMLIGDTVGAVAGRAWGGIRFKSARERKNSTCCVRMLLLLLTATPLAGQDDAQRSGGRKQAEMIGS